MKHIAIDARVINSSTGTYVERLLYYLQDIDTTNHYSILVRANDKDYWQPRMANFTVRVAEFDNYSLAEQIGYKTFLDKLGADLVHFCMPQQPILYKGLHVTTIHDLNLLHTYNTDKAWLRYHIKQWVGRYVFKRIAKTSARIIVPSEYTKNDYIAFAHIPEDSITLTYEAADVSLGEVKPYSHPFSQFILYVGQQSSYKNIRRLGDAHQSLLMKYPDLGLILVGSKNKSALMNEAYFTQKGYRNILFTDFIPNSQRDWLYTQTAAYVFPSLMEGFGLPGLEAMGYGAPVVASTATCIPEILGDAAHYFDPLDVNDMARAIDSVLSSEPMRKRMIEMGYAQVTKYSWRRMAEQTHTIYMDALSTNTQP